MKRFFSDMGMALQGCCRSWARKVHITFQTPTTAQAISAIKINKNTWKCIRNLKRVMVCPCHVWCVCVWYRERTFCLDLSHLIKACPRLSEIIFTHQNYVSESAWSWFGSQISSPECLYIYWPTHSPLERDAFEMRVSNNIERHLCGALPANAQVRPRNMELALKTCPVLIF